MNVTELKAVLAKLEALYAAGGASAAAKDLRSIAGLLEGHEEKSLDVFIEETRSLLDQPKSSAAATRASKAPANDALVASYVERLLGSGIDQVQFEPILTELDADKRTSRTEWFAIANGYRNTPTSGTFEFKFKSIPEARKFIRDTFIERHAAVSKREAIERLTKWAS
jgi:hypothetical protein